MPLGVEVLIDQETPHTPHAIPPKMTKLSSKLNLTKLFYISPQQNQETIMSQPVDMTRKLSQSKTITIIHQLEYQKYSQYPRKLLQ